MITFEEYGVPLTQQMGTMAADTSVSVLEASRKIKILKLHYDSGGTTYTPVLGDLITAHDNAWWGICLSCTIDTGTWAGGDAVGYLYLYNVEGTVVDNDVWNVVKASDSSAVADEGTTDGAGSYLPNGYTMEAPSGMLLVSGMEAKAAIIEATANPLRVTMDGTPPTPGTLTNGLTSRGIYLENGNVLICRGVHAVKNLKFCNATAGSNAAYNITYFF